MTAKELLKMLNEASDTAEIKIVDGEITITEPKKIEYKFKVGDKVIYQLWDNRSENMTVTEQLSINGCPCYILTSDNDDDFEVKCMEEDIHPYVPQDITERIKTFDDAVKWCVENGKREMLRTYSLIFNDLLNSESEITEDVDDIIAYLKLRIITCALNEEWEPSENDSRYVAYYDEATGKVVVSGIDGYYCDSSIKLCFYRMYLAEYAATQFADIYADFCGCKKGGEK